MVSAFFYIRTHSSLSSVGIRALDILHSAMICTANWQNLVVDYGEFITLDRITWSISVRKVRTVVGMIMVCLSRACSCR